MVVCAVMYEPVSKKPESRMDSSRTLNSVSKVAEK